MQDLEIKTNLAEQVVSDGKTPNKSPGNIGATTRGRPQVFTNFSGTLQPVKDEKQGETSVAGTDSPGNARSLVKKHALLQKGIKILGLGLSAKVQRLQKEVIPIMRSRICRSLDEIDLNQHKSAFLSFNQESSEAKSGLKGETKRATRFPPVDQHQQSSRRTHRPQVRFISRESSPNQINSFIESERKRTSGSLKLVARVLEQNRHNKSSLEASVEHFGRKVLASYQDGLAQQDKKDKLFESKVRQTPGFFVPIKKKTEESAKDQKQRPKVTFQMAPMSKLRDSPDSRYDTSLVSNPNDYRSPENQNLLKMLFQSPDNLFKKLKKLKFSARGEKDTKDKSMEKHESNQRIMTRIFTSEAFHSVIFE